ncbi:CLI_3235 family bacteriocin precursor [Paenibacillus sonchi]|uniref:CLI_3235 family bacteriocin n=1 Tax=Paenibacillus sonchi TaxID=373687 RepID=A0A974SDK1_9BACL|nr:CLI_3235 family bacteriocin precursor [Paenibacillus sonchi]QQZ61494.1 CLI_3235 family bacteriocin precursor [Paenibacillus sonchi]
MRKLNKKNFSQMHTVEAYADCHLSCACYCATCSCWGPDFLHVSNTSADSGSQNYTPTATAQVRG